ncbi:MAG: pimeloyl-ACP methyl ester carboxylesterase/membrane protein DedA with SNARE-associated domain [Verrucomicrobiales bacterium]|jgi:pimeloyl-ACP methyl ester carboxylesterase/membrane protein DedA with SNARE-associated domain
MSKLSLSLLLIYGMLLLASHTVRRIAPHEGELSAASQRVDVSEVKGGATTGRTIQIAYQDWNEEAGANAPVLVLLHGSPGDANTYSEMVLSLKQRYRLIIPDLPGFRGSSHSIADYSTAAHAHEVIQLLDDSGINRAHLVGYSMGGGVALDMVALAPERWDSLVFLSSLGVQELELLGDYTLNHAVHGLQLAALWLIQEGTPHFGRMDNAWINVAYARNFFDTDQRPFRSILERLQQPMLILHGTDDRLVPCHAALEHHRIVPQSELVTFEGDGHMMVFTDPERLVDPMVEFFNKVENGQATVRLTALVSRAALAAEHYQDHQPPRRSTGSLVFLMVLLALATFVTEDFTCIGAGLLVARGGMDFWAASLACFVGIFVGDLLLYFAGRWLGKPALSRAPLRWFLSPGRVDAGARFFADKGAALIFTTRFLPGTRLATYFAAGMLRAPFWRFAGWFALAAAVWTPILVGLAWLLGGQTLEFFERYDRFVFAGILGVILALWLLFQLVVPALSHRGRRLLLGRWRRMSRWEFWPMWLFYPPVVVYVLYLGIRFRCLTLFTAANPGIPEGGVVLESKREILDAFYGHEAIASYAVLDSGREGASLELQLDAFMRTENLSFPVVLKPDVGERGAGVRIVRSTSEASTYLEASSGDVIAQKYVPGREFGVFYYRYPEEGRGHILSITDKRLIHVTGDGQRTLEQLILDDERAVCMASYFFDQLGDAVARVPASGEKVSLTDVGTHCRGALFLDGAHLLTDDLVTAIDSLSKRFDGFYFGRYDIRVPTEEDLKRGNELQVLELNGVTSESTSIYDPRHSLVYGYRMLFQQWRIAFEIGARNAANGDVPVSLRALTALFFRFKHCK